MRILQGQDVCEFLQRRQGIDRTRDEYVLRIIDDVRTRGDEALREYAAKFDDLGDLPFRVYESEISSSASRVSGQFKAAVKSAARNIRRFAEWQKIKEWQRPIMPGVVVGQTVRPLENVGCYVPGGAYPLPSTLLMTVVPAQVAGVPQIVVTNPRPACETLATASIVNLRNFYRVGGAHAIAAMAFGTQSLPKVEKIVGPGNAYVAAAKRLLAGEVAIDSVAGPSEVVIVADEGRADWVAADLLAQAEHDPDASSLLITSSRSFAQKVAEQVTTQLRDLPTKETAASSLFKNGAILISSSTSEAMEWVNSLSPEHLCLHDSSLLKDVQHAGSVFLGSLSAEPLGDYASGPNHVLPTNGNARIRGGLSVNDFLKVITYQRVSESGLEKLAPTVTALARAEGLEAHARAVEVRL